MLSSDLPTKRTVRRRKELKLQPPALMLPSAPSAPPPRPHSRDCRQYSTPSPTMICRQGAAQRSPSRGGGAQGCPRPLDVGTHRGRRGSKGQAEQHEQWNEFLVGLHVGHGQRAVVTLETHLGRLEEVGQLQEVQGHDGGCHNGQLHRDSWPGSPHIQSLSLLSMNSVPFTNPSTYPCCSSPTHQLIHHAVTHPSVKHP